MPLTVKAIKQLIKAGQVGLYPDGDNLYLQIAGAGGRSWVFRYQVRGHERAMGLGPVKDFSLNEARELAHQARRQLRAGVDPIDARKAERAAQIAAVAQAAAKNVSFERAAQEYFRGHEQKWSNAEHRRQFLSTLQQYAFPVIIGKLPIAEIDTPLLLKILQPIWYDKTVTAGRVRNRIESVLDWATASGYRSGPNPAAWTGHLEAILPAKNKIRKVEHHAAMAYVQVPDFMATLSTQPGIEPKALQFLILTAARTSEVIKARWSEIDFENQVWTVPAGRIKGRKQHRVPLSDQVVALLQALPIEGEFVFPGARKGKPLGKMAMANLLGAMKQDDITVHGFRSSFRDWAAERSSFPREIIEECLAHKIGDDTELSYKRSDVLEKRRKLMKAWATFCLTPMPAAIVTPLRRSSAR